MVSKDWQMFNGTYRQVKTNSHLRLLDMSINNNEKKYECNTCDKSFTRKDYLNSHLKTHQCNKQFYTCDDKSY